MRAGVLLRRSLRHYRRTNAAVVLGVATAVAVLAGSLLVGESVRASLARLALLRLGRTAEAVTSPRFFREALAAEVAAQPGFAAAFKAVSPALALRGSVSRQDGSRLAGDVRVYGVDARFFALHGVPPPPELEARGAWLSPSLAAELRADAGQSLIVLVESASDVPGSTLFGRRDEPGRRVRVTSRGVLRREQLGEFSLEPTSHDVRAVFLPLPALQRALGLAGRVNALLASDRPESADAPALGPLVAAACQLEDLGLRLRLLSERGALSLESASAVLSDQVADGTRRVAREQGLEARDVFIHLANSIRARGREVPYSLVAALDPAALRRLAGPLEQRPGAPPPIVLNEWAAGDLGARPGDEIALDYYLWKEEGRLVTRSARFVLAATVPLSGEAADRDLVPEYPGISDTPRMSDWDPPFPVDLGRIRPKDEQYWERNRTTPKAFVPLGAGQELWGHRLGRLTSVRLVPPPGTDLVAARARYADALRSALLGGAPAEERLQAFGLQVTPARQRAFAAARGATDFGEYFVYFSFFLVAAALLLAGLFFRLGVEQRLREVGLLRALGFTPSRLRWHFQAEGLVLSVLGAALGALGAVLYARLMVLGLRTVWVGAVGTRELDLVVSARPLVLGALGGIAAAAGALAWTLHDLRRRTPRALLAGTLEEWGRPRPAARRAIPIATAGAAVALLAASWLGAAPVAGAFFGAGALLLAAALAAVAQGLAGRPREAAGIRSPAGLGARAASFRPGRSLVCVGLVASAAFVIVAVGAFRREGAADLRAPRSESGGFTLLALANQPLHHDPNTPGGREALGLPGPGLDGVTIARFRRSAGEDASCLNLYRPGRPTVLGAERSFLRLGRFAFQASLATTEEERANPWLLLERDAEGGAFPVVADGTALRYVLGKRLGDEMALGDGGVRVRFVASLRPGLLQSELVTAERHFQRAFAGDAGYRFFLLESPAAREAAVTELLESRLANFGFDVTEASERLAAYHRVENTYIATFQTLGALGLLLGTVGLAAVLLRNAYERRRELALLQAVGYRGVDLRRMVLSENALLLGLGLVAGLVPAVLAIAPALRERGGSVPLLTVAGLAVALVAVGTLVSSAAVAAIRRLPLLASLRSE